MFLVDVCVVVDGRSEKLQTAVSSAESNFRVFNSVRKVIYVINKKSPRTGHLGPPEETGIVVD
jgi:hypothetical protein